MHRDVNAVIAKTKHGENKTSITIAIVWRTIDSFDSFYTSNILTSLENKDTFLHTDLIFKVTKR